MCKGLTAYNGMCADRLCNRYFMSEEGNSVNYIKRLRDLREDHDMTQQEVADYLNTSQTMYARYERGANELPIRHLIKLAELYNVSVDYLLCLTENPKRMK